jgi:phage regulator Rha-like protein
MAVNEMEKFEESIREKIYSIRGFQVMLDRDLAELYGVETKQLKRSVNRNVSRFPEEFMFVLTEAEFISIYNLRCQNGTSSWGGTRYSPYAFTEQGVAMLSAVLKSDSAIQMSIKIIKAFVSMRKFIQTNAHFFSRIVNIENRLLNHDHKFDKLFSALESQELRPKQGIFFDGQIFDAYKFVSDLFRRAQKSILIIDNYVDDSVLTILSKRKSGVKASLYTKKISAKLNLDVKKFNEQYEAVEVLEFDNSHDRFIVIDEKIIYHFGASLKDLGKKWFGFSKMEIEAVGMLSRLGK